MKVTALEVLPIDVPLSRPYAIANAATDAVSMVRVRVRTSDGITGTGAATPEPRVTGETFAMCTAALHTAAQWLPGRTFTAPRDLTPALRDAMLHEPGARAAIDMALHDAWGKSQGRPVVDLLGRVHDAMPTSITIGVLDVPATLAEAREYLGRGFRVLKVKIGENVDLDVERLVKLRELVGPQVLLLADGNVGYTATELTTLLTKTRALDIRLIEQPLPPEDVDAQRSLAAADVDRLVADESLHEEADAERHRQAPRAFGVYNIKLMKCGGITPALGIAKIADAAGIGLMWGCMDESVVGIAAALHAAFASRATRWLDLDGSFDLSRDFAKGGFSLANGVLRTLDRPGLGVEDADGS